MYLLGYRYNVYYALIYGEFPCLAGKIYYHLLIINQTH